MRYYITPDAHYKLGGDANYIAFDNYYTARFKRTSTTKLVLAIDYNKDTIDQRPNDLIEVENGSSFLGSGFHSKDYHLYIWALMEQIDAKLYSCSMVASTEVSNRPSSRTTVFPNPSHGNFTIKTNQSILDGAYFLLTDHLGRIIERLDVQPINHIELQHAGIYFLMTADGVHKIVVH
ncbi:MAG: hypothetical protein AAGI23_20200 [Bacteroidota bacterium]